MVCASKMQQDAERRIDQHGERRQRVDRHHHEGDVGRFAGIIRHHGGNRQRRRCAAHRGADADQRAEARPAPVPAREGETGGERRQHGHYDQNRGPRPERGDIGQAHAQAEQRHRPAQHRAHAKPHAGLHGRPRRDRVERDADHQRDHHAGDRHHMRDVGCGEIADSGDQSRQRHARRIVGGERQGRPSGLRIFDGHAMSLIPALGLEFIAAGGAAKQTIG